VIDWCEASLAQPDGPDAGAPWRFTNEQVKFVLCWYQVDDDGRFVYRSGVLRRMKGWGKNPFAAALCSVEFIGPCRFGGFGKRGVPIARSLHMTLVRAAAVSQDQTRNLMTLFPAMIRKSVALDHRIEFGKEIIYAHGGRSRIEALTSSSRSTEGGRVTKTLRDETQHWLSTNDGHAMAKVIERDAAKARGGMSRVLSITNAHRPGEDSVAERDWEAYQKMASGSSKGTGLLYDALEAPPDTSLVDESSLRRGLELARGDSTWVDIQRLVEEIWDPRTSPSDSRRFYLDQIVAAEDAWVAPHEWDTCEKLDPVVAKTEITLGFDGSKSDDWCALVGCRVSDSQLFTIGLWDPAASGGEAPRAEIDAAVHRAFATYLVNGFYSDVHPWESYVDAWEAEWGEDLYVSAGFRHAIAWDLRGRTREATEAVESFHDAILEHTLTHTGDKRANQHVYNARRRPNQYGVSFGKEHRESVRKVDWLSAAVLARLARQNYLTLPESKRRKKRTGRVMFA
jgi:phage terminase large subunit-like protein